MRLFSKDVILKCHSEGRSPEESPKSWCNEEILRGVYPEQKDEILRFAQNDRTKSRAGFTLLELTISITMIGFIVLIIVGALRLGYRSVESGEKRIEALERIRSSINIINSQIQSQIPLKYTEEEKELYYFKGESEFMQFATNYSIWGGEKGYVITTYRTEPGDNGKQILFASESVIGMDLERETKLFDTFDRVYFEYFYRDLIEQEGYWVEQLSDGEIIPEKVMLHLVDGRKELLMVIPVRVKGSPVQVFGSPEKFIGPLNE